MVSVRFGILMGRVIVFIAVRFGIQMGRVGFIRRAGRV